MALDSGMYGMEKIGEEILNGTLDRPVLRVGEMRSYREVVWEVGSSPLAQSASNELGSVGAL